MKTRRNTGGFTLLELMLAVAVIGILSAVVAVNVAHYQRTLTQLELDGIAREIFVAAQNHLTMAESQGFMGIVTSDNPTRDSETQKLVVGVDYTDTSDTYYYYVVNDALRTTLNNLKTRDDTDKLNNMLDLMLPFASVDETVRTTDGSYVIRYQKDPALVLDVFYASTSGRFPHTFGSDDDNISPQWIDEYRGSDSDKKQWRGNYPEKKGTDIIGWYGVEPQHPTVQKGELLSPPTVKIVNAEQLYVEVTNPNLDKYRWETFKTARLHLEITGLQSGKKFKPIELISDSGYPVRSDYITHMTFHNNNENLVETYRVILDDVTQDTTRFYKIMGDAGLYPGEDISICAVAYNNTELTNIATSASSTTNSLFALPIENTTAASISNFRHLENLDSAVSDIDTDKISGAKQISDMDWEKFCENIKKLKQEEGKTQTVQVYSDGENSNDGYYLPIHTQSKLEYTGKLTENGTDRAAKISNVKIDVTGNAGLFATLGYDSTVKDLELVNFSVDSSGNAGALAGVLDDSIVQCVLVHHDHDKSGDGYKVTGKDAAGGLVGLINGTCAIEQSAAAVYVTSSSGDAGGLIGTVSRGASATIKDSYAGGHTKNGKYEEDRTEKGYYNVTATNGNAGGLIGGSAVTSTANLTVANCYATTSVDGTMTAGGLIGDVQGGRIKNCYVTGYVNKDSTAGVFVGKAKNTQFENDNRYLSIVNPGFPDEEAPANMIAFDTPDEYSIYAPCTSGAVPYDPTLTQYYGGNYLFKTIRQLSGTDTAEWMTKHYGDWHMPETQVVNTNKNAS